jgi:hypothetical protein
VADWTLATDASLTLRSGGAYHHLCQYIIAIEYSSTQPESTCLTTDVGVQFLFEHVGSHRFC